MQDVEISSHSDVVGVLDVGRACPGDYELFEMAPKRSTRRQPSDGSSTRKGARRAGTDGAAERSERTLVAAASDVETAAGGCSAVQSSTALPPADAMSGLLLVSTTCPPAAGGRGVFPAAAAVKIATPAISGDRGVLPVAAVMPAAGATPIIGKRSRRATPSGGTLFRWRKYGVVLLTVLANNDAEFTLIVSGSTKP
jgi:hypothetical protein